MDHIIISNHVVELDQMGRERAFKYAHINLILYPDFYIVQSGTMADIFNNSHKCIGDLFLYWDNMKIIVSNGIRGFQEYVKKLEDNGFVVEVEKK